ncbi:class I SAM-dependent DNA methyltransferase [Aureispira anguillae]|uniref:Class I SAM-dependent methyltransferase n=1 Tax=Aureispira anguillae TaxID=2864201 RepID=A0A915YDG1_9BACT|nr:class I SAM-dependent methyltransferase [Aureispira anguillae]BDS11040.1 class I SAM-dependent methyltransferase [Aureispira anguillae]
MDKTEAAIALFDSVAQEYQDKFMDLSLYQQSLDVFCESIKDEKAKVLELACGPGNITQYLLSKKPDWDILATDLAPAMLKLAKKNNPTAKFQALDSRKIDQLNEQYKAIIAGFLIPYLPKDGVEKLIQDAFNLLEEGGILFLSTMEDDFHKSGWKGPSSGGEKRLYTYYYQADYLKSLLEKYHFTIMDLRRVQQHLNDENAINDVLIIAKK